MAPTTSRNRQRLRAGSRVRLSGGYDQKPEWLNGHTEYRGTLERFIPGQNRSPAAVVRLDAPIAIGPDAHAASIAVLELRFEGATWHSRETVHVELCDFEPEARRWQDRRQGSWVESHATIQLLDLQIRIVSTPPGEAPEEVRRAWVGMCLPIAGSDARARVLWVDGVLTGPKTVLASIVAILRGRTEKIRGFEVQSRLAIELLAAHSPQAADWWRSKAPHSCTEHRRFVFPADVCELIEGEGR